ncbi:carboxylesterase family protein [Vibrio genomosp. F10]|uniref:carboxylesterase family protein n=1 Tax=Vibrio genomosp. F10 TaxID=723171 RepID=UPI0002D3FAAE|nr:carboxylesterase family protein [Vibrio genomosp. F10]OEF08561.1 para-nitrobenzyl esterase [Vibrio genomosp. F10 str. 9ZB36]
MNLTHRSLIAVAITVALSACGSDETSSRPIKPEPLQPLPTEQVSVSIGDATLLANRESVVINTLAGDEQRVSIEAFKGITYADQQRFQHSQLRQLEDNADGAIDVTQFGAVCPQLKITQQAQSEDCLNLNIWRPSEINGSESLPVYVFIHGGDFEYGAGSDAIINGDTVVAQGVSDDQPFIVVTFNYRLGLLGSMWVDGKTDPEGGNYGLGDQKRALEWVNQNIVDFGGNPDNVVLMGQGAGAMSVGILQQQESKEPVTGETNNYFQRAVMQSNPYGFDYRNYTQAKDAASKVQNYSMELHGTQDTESLSLQDLMTVQAKVLNPINKIGAWTGLDCIDLDKADYGALCLTSKVLGEDTPMANVMSFAPYIEYKKLIIGKDYGHHLTVQPSLTEFTVPTVLGVNSEESNGFGMLPSLTFLIPTIIELINDLDSEVFNSDDPETVVLSLSSWLSSPSNLVVLEDEINSLTAEEIHAQIELEDVLNLLPSSAYEAITKLFFGLGHLEDTNKVLALTDYMPNPEGQLGGALSNMSEFKQLLNDVVFAGPSRSKAMASNQPVTFYHFGYRPSFNVWTYETQGSLDIGDVTKSIGCISGACNASELPFVFNKAVKLDGTEVHPSSNEVALMNQMSRLWFSDALFSDYEYSAQSDSVMVIDDAGEIGLEYDWDRYTNEGIDPELRNGRLTGLEKVLSSVSNNDAFIDTELTY